MKLVKPLTNAPKAFAALAAKLNEFIAARPPLVAGAGICITESSNRAIVSMDFLTDTTVVFRRLLLARTFFAYAGTGTQIIVTAGVLNNVVFEGDELTGAMNNDKVWIRAAMTAGTNTVTDITVARGAAVPANTSTLAHAVIASVSVAGGNATVTALAWNYSQVQRCGGYSDYVWGGHGGQ